jgi:hypothetical protein
VISTSDVSGGAVEVARLDDVLVMKPENVPVVELAEEVVRAVSGSGDNDMSSLPSPDPARGRRINQRRSHSSRLGNEVTDSRQAPGSDKRHEKKKHQESSTRHSILIADHSTSVCAPDIWGGRLCSGRGT